MTPGAVVSDIGVIKHSTGKFSGVMAHPAIFGSRDVRGGFTCGDSTVVAGCAIIGDTLVSKD